jgi:hypothetical protein
LLGDGALYANAPVEIVLGGEGSDEVSLLILLESFARDGARPAGASLACRQELFFGNQTYRALTALLRERDLRLRVSGGSPASGGNGSGSKLTVLYLGYRPSPKRDPRRSSISRSSLGHRWQEGAPRHGGSDPAPHPLRRASPESG